MKKLLLVISCLFIVLTYNAQTELWGMTSSGGQYDAGTIFKTDGSGNNLSIEHSFYKIEGGGSYYTNLTQAGNGKLYGMTSGGGMNNEGILFEYDAVTNIYLKKIDFDAQVNGSYPKGSLLLGSDGKFYGMTSDGGINNSGILFQYDQATNLITKKYDFNYTNGNYPLGSLMQALDGKFYGMTQFGGLNNYGVIFQYDYTTNTYTKKIDFDGTVIGGNPYGSLIQATDGKLYGMNHNSGPNNLGVLFQYDYNTNVCINKLDFDGINTGRFPKGSLIQASDGKLYGMTEEGGINNMGVLFQFNPVTNGLVKKVDFNYNTGFNPKGSLFQASDGMLYGMTYDGGLNSAGTLFQYNTSTDTYLKKMDFDPQTNGGNPYGSVMQASDGKLYGMNYNGGPYGSILFQYDPALSIFTKKIDFGAVYNGGYPVGSLLLASNGKLYGLAPNGGVNNKGILFEYDRNTHVLSTKFDFTATILGSNPSGYLMEASDGKIYGTTKEGGVNSMGVLFQYDPNSNLYAKKFDFDGSANGSGASVNGPLLQASDGKLYGMTGSGGSFNFGTLFQYDITSNSFIKKIDFSYSNGSQPFGSLMQASNGKLYGMTYIGGINYKGVLFEYDILTSVLAKKFDFSLSDGYNPWGSLIETTPGTLHGMVQQGGDFDFGVIFKFDINTGLYAKIIDFDGTMKGCNPLGSLMKATNGMLYGTTVGCGANNFNGVMFQFNPNLNSYTKKIDFSGITTGGHPYGNLIEVPLTPTIIKQSGNSNNIVLYPNPNNGAFTIELKTKFQITITNTLGETIFNQYMEAGKQTLNIQNQTNGIYFVKVTDTNGCTTKKVIVNR